MFFEDGALLDFKDDGDDDTSVGEETVPSPTAVDSQTPGIKTAPLLACLGGEGKSSPAMWLRGSGAAKMEWGTFI